MTMSDQERVCRDYGATCMAPLPSMKLGVAQNIMDGLGLLPINGLRHPPTPETAGWYIWAGESLSRDPDFFVPAHVWHLHDLCPEAVRFLGLPPGWRFLIAPGHEDVWFDPELLRAD
jgi:hypothetical protein